MARRALAAGAAMINDVSGLADPELATACAETGAALVITHTRTPKTKAFPVYDDVVEEVAAFLGERVELARAKGIGEERLVLDPGIDLEDPGRVGGAAALATAFAGRGLLCCSPSRARTSSARSPAARLRHATRAHWRRSARRCAGR